MIIVLIRYKANDAYYLLTHYKASLTQQGTHQCMNTGCPLHHGTKSGSSSLPKQFPQHIQRKREHISVVVL